MITIAVQAGGNSRRMGVDKGLVHLGGKALIEHVLDKVRGLGDELLIVTNQPKDYAYLDVPLVPDSLAASGALVGLHTALEQARGDRVLVLACDMPFLNRPLLEHLIEISPRAEVTVPRRGEYYEPLHAVYQRSCLTTVRQLMALGKQSLTSLYPLVELQLVEEDVLDLYDPEGRSFFNVNTPEDLAQAEVMLGGG